VKPAWDETRADAAIAPFDKIEGPMLPMLHALMHEFGAISDEAIVFLAGRLNLTRAEVYGVVSFYHDFRREPAGRRVVKVCRAEACQSVGGVAVAEALLAAHGLGWGDTSADGELTIEPVYCLGLCAVAPAALIDGQPVGRLDAAKLKAAVAA
jgi:formate dehydrogenase subunit gamma